MTTLTALSYDDGDFTYRPMVVAGQERARAEELAGQGMENVTLTTYAVKGKKRTPILTETCYLTGHPSGDGMLMVWSSVTP